MQMPVQASPLSLRGIFESELVALFMTSGKATYLPAIPTMSAAREHVVYRGHAAILFL